MAGPDLTVDTTGNPFVEVFFNPADLPAGTTRIRIYRFSDNRTWLVRGGVDIAPGVAALDFECPFGVPATYRAEAFNGSATLGFTDTASITLDVDDVWVHNPLVPSGGVALGSIALLAETGSRNVRPTVGEAVYTEGSVEATWIGSRRRGVQGMPFGFAVDTISKADSLQAMLGGYNTAQVGVLCIRTQPGPRFPRTFFAAVSEPDEVSLDIEWGGSRSNFVFAATEVKPPFPGLVTPLLRYDDIDYAYSTYDLADAAYANTTLRDRDYSLAGVAG